jgi:hypothetical protein
VGADPPHISSSEVEGARWYLRDRTGKRVTSLFMTPDGRLGSRTELRLRYTSQRLWTDKKQRAWQRMKVVERLEGPASFSWVVDHPDYVSRKKRLMSATTYRKLMARLETHR